jgi:hypothetical protein
MFPWSKSRHLKDHMSHKTLQATATALVSSVSIREDNPVVAVARTAASGYACLFVRQSTPLIRTRY